MDEHGQDPWRRERERLVRELSWHGVRDPRVLDAFGKVPRHEFVVETRRSDAYEDRALPLIEGQTISQPTMIAIMLEALGCEPHHKVLEVGGGCGYAAALLVQLAGEVHTIEIRPSLAEYARAALSRANITGVNVHVGDGTQGLPAHAPFDRILVSAAASAQVPAPLVDQLAPDGRIVIPVGTALHQSLRVGSKRGDEIVWVDSVACLFVPLVHSPES